MSTCFTCLRFDDESDRDRLVYQHGGKPMFSDGSEMPVSPQLLGFLRSLEAQGVRYEPVPFHQLNLFGFSFRGADGQLHFVAQFVLVDDGMNYAGGDEAAITWDLAVWKDGEEPHLVACVIEGGTLGIWPEAVDTDLPYPESQAPRTHYVCLVHGEVELVLPDVDDEDPEDSDLEDEEHIPGHELTDLR